MADKIEVEVSGKSKFEVAHLIAFNIITLIEGKNLKDVSRDHYLKTVSQAVQALQGHL